MTTAADSQHTDVRSSPYVRRVMGIAAATGLAVFAVTLADLGATEPPETGQATAAEIRRFAVDNANTLKLGLVAGLFAVVLFTIFVAALAQLAREARTHSTVPGVLLLSGAVGVALSALNTAARSIFAFPGELASVSDGTIVAWFDFVRIVERFGFIVGVGTNMVLVAAFSVLALRTRLMARWVCWAGIAVAACGLAAGALDWYDPLSPLFLVPLFGFWLWPLAVGGALGVRWLRTRPAH